MNQDALTRITNALRNEELMHRLLSSAVDESVKVKSTVGKSVRRGQVERDALIIQGLKIIVLALSLEDE